MALCMAPCGHGAAKILVDYVPSVRFPGDSSERPQSNKRELSQRNQHDSKMQRRGEGSYNNEPLAGARLAKYLELAEVKPGPRAASKRNRQTPGEHRNANIISGSWSLHISTKNLGGVALTYTCRTMIKNSTRLTLVLRRCPLSLQKHTVILFSCKTVDQMPCAMSALLP